jgi:hypothetical protein
MESTRTDTERELTAQEISEAKSKLEIFADDYNSSLAETIRKSTLNQAKRFIRSLYPEKPESSALYNYFNELISPSQSDH